MVGVREDGERGGRAEGKVRVEGWGEGWIGEGYLQLKDLSGYRPANRGYFLLFSLHQSHCLSIVWSIVRLCSFPFRAPCSHGTLDPNLMV